MEDNNLKNKERKIIKIKVKATPKMYSDNLKLNFTYSYNGLETKSIEGVLGHGQSYTGSIDIPMADKIEIGVTIDDGNSKKEEIRGNITDIKEQYKLQFNYGEFSGNYKFKDGKIILDAEFIQDFHQEIIVLKLTVIY